MDKLSLPMLNLLFVGAAYVVWVAGTRLPNYAASIAAKTGIGQVFAGMLLLGSITTLPELATSLSAAGLGAPHLALNNVLGSAAFNIFLLAVADAALGRNALTAVIATPATLLQGVLGMLLLATVATAAAAGDSSLFGAGFWSSLVFALCLGSLWIASTYETRATWIVAAPAVQHEATEQEKGEGENAGGQLSTAVGGLLVFGLLILLSGFMLAQLGDLIARRTGLGGSLIGVALLAVATSLPEFSTITGAIRKRRHELAVGDVFGANLLNIAMIFLIDLLYRGDPVLDIAGSFEVVAALLPLILSGIFVIGLLERRDRTFARMGFDSIAVLLVYIAGVAYLGNMATMADTR